jgi:uracil phosphoribosyltransferase
MLATGGSLEHACRTLADRGAGPLTAVCVLAAPEGIDRIAASGLVAHVVTASIDQRLDDSAYIVPGLGDAGDRLFGTA